MNHRLDKYSTRKKARGGAKESSDQDEEENPRIKTKTITSEKARIRQRQENSLSELTKNFINFIKSQGDKTININDVVKKLKVKKRRIYDITNVLEGIGYIKKQGKNKIEWVDQPNPKLDIDHLVKSEILDHEYSQNTDKSLPSIEYDEEEHNSQIEILQKEISDLYAEEDKLDCWINEIKTNFEKLNEDKAFKDYGYVTFDDLKALTLGEDINLIAVKATQGTSVEIPDPEQIHRIYLQSYESMKSGKEDYDQSLLDSLSKKYQIFLDSPNGEINVYLVLSKNEESENTASRPVSAFRQSTSTAGSNVGNFNHRPRSSFDNVLQQNNSYKNLQKSKNY